MNPPCAVDKVDGDSKRWHTAERGMLFTAEIRGKNNRFYKSMPR